MPDQVTPPGQPTPGQETKRRTNQPKQERPRFYRLSATERELAMSRFSIIIALLYELVAIVLLGLLVGTIQCWQSITALVMAILGLAGPIAAARQLQKQNTVAAGNIILFALVLVQSSNEWLFQSLTSAILLSGVPLILIVGQVVLPRHKRRRLLAVGIFIGSVALANLWQPFPRIDPTPFIPFAPETPYLVLVGVVVLSFLSRIGFTFRFGTIRSRLLTYSLVTSTVLAVALTTVSALISYDSGREAAYNRLDLAATLQENEINNWADALQENLGTVIVTNSAGGYMDPIDLLTNLGSSPVLMETGRQLMQDQFTRFMEHSELYDELFLVDSSGKTLVSSDPARTGRSFRFHQFFLYGQQGPYFEAPHFMTTRAEGQLSVITAMPIQDESGNTVAVLAGRTELDEVLQIINKQAAEGTKITLVNSRHFVLLGTEEENPPQANSSGIRSAVDIKLSGTRAYLDHLGELVIGSYRWLPQLEAGLLVEQSQLVAFLPTFTTIAISIGIGVLGALAAAGSALILTRSIASPLSGLADTAQKISSGDLNLTATVDRDDEIGELATAFNVMTAQLRIFISSLEQRVADRTRALAERSGYLEAAADVSQAATSILDPDRLITEAVELIRERFDLYYVGLFLIDNSGQWAVLRAGTGAAGQAMLARQHKLEIGSGMIGWSIANAEARISLEAEQDAIRQATSELPETRSEAAIPLRSRGQVLGALTVQDRRVNAFNHDLVAVLQTMADQIAVGLDNARLFAQSEQALEAQQRAYGEMSRQAWLELVSGRTSWGYRYNPHTASLSQQQHVAPLEQEWEPTLAQATQKGEKIQLKAQHNVELGIPIKIRDQVIGALSFKKEGEDNAWTEQEIQILEALTEQLEVALENARLYQATQRRAAYDRFSSEMSDRLRESLDLETVLKTAVNEIRQMLALPEVVVRLVPDANKQQANGDNEY